LSAFHVRLATEADLPAVSRLMAETWTAAYAAFIPRGRIAELTAAWHAVERLARQIAKPELVFLVADSEGRIVGHAAAARENGEEVFLRRLYVHPEAQGRGVGRALFDAIVAALPDTHGMRLETFAENVRGIAFYRRLGFEITPETADGSVAWEGLVEYTMTRPSRAPQPAAGARS
jgi:ribosomal protein S18 acetylase RimI-like enzyme